MRDQHAAQLVITSARRQEASSPRVGTRRSTPVVGRLLRSERERRAFSSESLVDARGMADERDSPKTPPRRWLELFAISRVERARPVLVKNGCL